jgi:cell division septation protein DedD
VGEISANLWKIQDVLGQQRMVLDEFRAAVQWREEYLIHTTDAPYYVPPTQPPTTQTPTSQPDQKPKTEPAKIPTGWILAGLVAVIFVVQIVAVIVVRKKQKQQYDEFDE